MRLAIPPLLFASLLAAPAPAFAGDWYVDPSSGSNANSGSSPAQAWATVAFALTQVPVGFPETIHLARGTYSADSGEVFPWVLRPRFLIVGDQGAEATEVDGGGTAAFLIELKSSASSPASLHAETGVRGLTLRRAGVGVRIVALALIVAPTLEDLLLEENGVALLVASAAPGIVRPTCRRMLVRANGVGLNLNPGSMGSRVLLQDCAIRANQGPGVQVGLFAGRVELERCKVEGNGTGVRFSNLGAQASLHPSLLLTDTTLSGNAAGGLQGLTAFDSGASTVRLLRCTLAHNGGVGAKSLSTPGPWNELEILGSILAGNADDLLLDGAGPVRVRHTCIGDGDFAGQNGNFQADPLFVDPARGDWRLAWGSPCIEAGDPATPAGVRDLAGNARPIDGDLDVVERADCGAYEFAPLFARGAHQLGAPLVLELWGPASGSATLYFAQAPPLASPLTTPFGDFDLDPALAFPLQQVPVAPGPPALFTRPIPPDLALAGLGLSFQALTTSSAAPGGRAFSNPVAIVPSL